jgi:hypothetical protein
MIYASSSLMSLLFVNKIFKKILVDNTKIENNLIKFYNTTLFNKNELELFEKTKIKRY